MSTKKFALNNSYFKNRRPGDPDTLPEIVTHHKQHGELPFRYDGDNWPYDTVCERQKRRGVVLCQFLRYGLPIRLCLRFPIRLRLRIQKTVQIRVA